MVCVNNFYTSLNTVGLLWGNLHGGLYLEHVVAEAVVLIRLEDKVDMMT